MNGVQSQRRNDVSDLPALPKKHPVTKRQLPDSFGDFTESWQGTQRS